LTTQPISLKDRLSELRQQAQEEHTFDLSVPGYENVLVARYRSLSYRDQRKIGQRHENEKDQIELELNVAADMLITACQAVLAKNDDGSLVEIGKWNVQTAQEQFGVDFGDHAGTATARQAITSILSDTNLMRHFADWLVATTDVNQKVDEVVQGESEPSLEG
jgi:hypothetical protein